MTPPSEKLKPCPFCGREVKLDFISNDGERAAWMVHCSNDGSHSATCASRSKDAAIADWNARVPQVPEASEPWIAVEDRLPDHYGNVLARCQYGVGIAFKKWVPTDGEGNGVYGLKWEYRPENDKSFADGLDANYAVTHWMPIPGFRACERLNRKEGANA